MNNRASKNVVMASVAVAMSLTSAEAAEDLSTLGVPIETTV
jgi:hypothetical protein